MLHLLNDLPDDIDSKYRLVHIAAKRAKQINRGAQPLLNTKAFKPTTVAVEEVVARKVKIDAPPAQWEAAPSKQAAPESRASWFRHIPPEELIAPHLVSEEEKEGIGEFGIEATREEFGTELDEGHEGDLEGGVEEFDPISEVALEEEIGGVEIEGGKEGED